MASNDTNKIIAQYPRLTTPIKKSRAIPAPTRVWSEEEMSSMKLGYFARDMNEKWIIFMEGNRLFAHRSWSMIRIYEANFISVESDYFPVEVGDYFPVEVGYRIDTAIVNDHRYQWPAKDDEWESAYLELLIAGHLLGERVHGQMPSSGNQLLDMDANAELTMPQMTAERDRIWYHRYLASKD